MQVLKFIYIFKKYSLKRSSIIIYNDLSSAINQLKLKRKGKISKKKKTNLMKLKTERIYKEQKQIIKYNIQIAGLLYN